jgi:hypothetical protein
MINKDVLQEKEYDFIRDNEHLGKNVILAGVHDVKSLKLKIRADEDHKYNSPWNIA